NGLCDDQRLYYLNDANFNVTALLNTAGDAVERYVYSPYGVVTIYDATWTNSRSASTYANVTLYTGRELEAEIGLYYYRNRYYGAELGRFVSRDVIGYVAGDTSLCHYCGNPLIATDSTGTMCTLQTGGAVNRRSVIRATAGGLDLGGGLSPTLYHGFPTHVLACSRTQSVTGLYECCCGWGPWKRRYWTSLTFEAQENVQMRLSHTHMVEGPSIPVPFPGRIGLSITWYRLEQGTDQALADRDCKGAPFSSSPPVLPATAPCP
ncbi:MAG: RHS repeat-associated core domain-containing protein, partial [Planctomycetaceae bacterium]